MTLRSIVTALGGDLYCGGARANVPAPGHSEADRSVSLLLSEGRVVIHGFGGTDWRTMRDDLLKRGFIDRSGKLACSGFAGASISKPDRRQRLETAARLWDDALPLREGSTSDRYLRHRAVRSARSVLNLRHHPNAPTSVYRGGSRVRHGLIARISDTSDRLTAVELTYLDPNGRLASGLSLVRKTVGVVPPGAAVRLSAAGEEMLVGEGVVTTLSAVDRFGLPGWALMAANNLAAWSPPPEVRRVLIAADRGAVGQSAALRLLRRLISRGVAAEAVWPNPPFGDWNDVEADEAKRREKEGR
jgi:hypothetical protein